MENQSEKKDIFDRIISLGIFAPLNPMYRKYKEILLYIFFGGLTTVVSIGSYSALVLSGMNALTANVIAWILAVLFAYVTNSIWVFESKASGTKERLAEMGKFYGGRVSTLLMEEGILLLFVEILSMNEFSVKFAAQVLVLVGNYLISKILIFGKTE